MDEEEEGGRTARKEDRKITREANISSQLLNQ